LPDLSNWPSSKAKKVLKALLKIGFTVKSQSGSHIQLVHPTRGDYTFSSHESEEIGPVMLSKIGKKTGLKPEDL
jgi:predicted RNA binding protein YcfA (HicA-like mRNA interferase family)